MFYVVFNIINREYFFCFVYNLYACSKTTEPILNYFIYSFANKMLGYQSITM